MPRGVLRAGAQESEKGDVEREAAAPGALIDPFPPVPFGPCRQVHVLSPALPLCNLLFPPTTRGDGVPVGEARIEPRLPRDRRSTAQGVIPRPSKTRSAR